MSSSQLLASSEAALPPQRSMTPRHALAAVARCAVLPPALGACGGSDEGAATAPTVSADWNLVATQAWTQLKATAGAPIDPHYESPSLAMASAAVHDVLNAIERRYAPYASDAKQLDASPNVAVAQAAHDVALGQAAAAYYVQLRASDAAHMAPLCPNPKGNGTLAGECHYTVPFNSPGAPFFGGSIGVPDRLNMMPFVVKSTTYLAPPGPYAPGSAAFAADLAEVTSLGAAVAPTRTADQSQIADFFQEDSPLMWNRIGRVASALKALKGWDQARLCALLNLALADVHIVCAQVVEQFNFWRPGTAIHFTNPASTWQQHGFPTPPTHDYGSGHSMEGGAASTVLGQVLGIDTIALSVTSTGKPRVTRSFASIGGYVAAAVLAPAAKELPADSGSN